MVVYNNDINTKLVDSTINESQNGMLKNKFSYITGTIKKLKVP